MPSLHYTTCLLFSSSLPHLRTYGHRFRHGFEDVDVEGLRLGVYARSDGATRQLGVGEGRGGGEGEKGGGEGEREKGCVRGGRESKGWGEMGV